MKWLILTWAISGGLVPQSNFLFNPYRQDYGFSLALYYGPFEIGLKHECDHAVTSPIFKSWYEKGETQFYIKLENHIEF